MKQAKRKKAGDVIELTKSVSNGRDGVKSADRIRRKKANVAINEAVRAQREIKGKTIKAAGIIIISESQLAPPH